MGRDMPRAVAIVGVGAVLPDAPNAHAYLENLREGRYSISEVPDDRWNPDYYYDPDPTTPAKTYSTIGGWVNDYEWDPLGWRLPLPPKVTDAMDRTQKWAIVASREALADYGYPNQPLDADRTAVVFGNAMGGEQHYLTTLPIYFPEYAEELREAPSFASLPEDVRGRILEELNTAVLNHFPPTTEDTMPGELGNIVAGRVANLFNFHGPNFITDAACASALAAIDAAIEGLENNDYDAVLTGGIDANMGINSFVKFCKIGALSASGTRPYHDGADGFVMGEGAAVILLKRLADAERDRDHIYAVIRGIGGSSDGKGKGITAPNPVGQEFAVARGWRNAGITPDRATYIEGHGTSTKVGDVVEFDALSRVFADLGLKPGSIPLGSVKSNIGHLKAAAGSAGLLKATLALDRKVLFPSLGDTAPNPRLDFENSPLYINKELVEWKTEPDQVRAAGVSAFGFGGTNFHVVLEEYVPGRISVEREPKSFVVKQPPARDTREGVEPKVPLRGALVVGAKDETELLDKLKDILAVAENGEAPAPMPPAEADLRADVRIAVDYGNAEELATKLGKAIAAIETDNKVMWKALHNQGVYLGSGPAPIVAFLYTGQGSQYVNMLAELREVEPIVAEMFQEADAKMTPILGKPLTDYIYVDGDDPAAVGEAEDQLRNTEITQPAVLSVDLALTRLLEAYGIRPAMVMGHSLGEYGALVAARAMPFPDSLEAVAGRGREMSNIQVDDRGLMAAVFAPIEDVQRVVAEADGYVVIANNNSTRQSVIGGATDAVERAAKTLSDGGHHVVPLSVSHAFHTDIVSAASEPLKRLLATLELNSAEIPIVANVTGEMYPRGPDVTERMIDILGRQVASPVQFVKGLETLHAAGARMFVEVGPKRALQGFVNDVFGDDPDVSALATNHPKQGDLVSFNHALCGLYAAGLGATRDAPPAAPPTQQEPATAYKEEPVPAGATATSSDGQDAYNELGRLFADFLEKGNEILNRSGTAPKLAPSPTPMSQESIVITGAGLGVPGRDRVFADDNVSAILHGEQFIDNIPQKYRRLMTEKHITRLVKSEDGGGRFEDIESSADVIKLAGRAGALDLVSEFGFPEDRLGALDKTSALAIGAGIEALRDAGIPLAMHYKTTTTGSKLPERWMLPDAYRDTTGVIFASAFPGYERWVEEVERFDEFNSLHDRLEDLELLRSRMEELGGTQTLAEELDRRIHELQEEIAEHDYHFDRKFLYQALSFGHAQFAEYIGARGPNTQLNAACASTTQAVAVAEDWIRAGRCDRVVIVAGDDVTSEHMIEWIGSGFLAMGAAATDDVVEHAALPFDRRRHGLILGMGAAGLVVESQSSVAQRGIRPISEVLSTVTANSAFHGSRLDTSHIKHVMEKVVSEAERRWGIDRRQIAPHTVFISHETYTPARGGSAQAEIDALRYVFGNYADNVVISNTKGFTGHAMGAGIEDVVAVKALETGMAPPIPNFEEPDPDLGTLNLSKGGSYPIEYALRLGAGFGSQVSLSLLRRVPGPNGAHREPAHLGYEYRVDDPAAWQRWLNEVTGHQDARVEIEKRTLRVIDQGAPTKAPEQPDLAVAPAMAPTVVTPQPETEPVATTEPEAEVVAEAPAESDDGVARTVLEIVSEQTGYPPDMLDLDLDLEADLGVDTVKQAETFAAIRERYGIERDDSLALRDYPTLQHVIGFVYERAPGLTQETSQPEPEAEVVAEAPAESDDGVARTVLEIVSEQTGYPPDMLDLDLDLEADLGVDTVKQAETFAAIRERYGIERDDSLALRDYPTLQHVIGFVYERAPGLTQETSQPEPEAEVVAEAPAESDDGVARTVLEIVSEQTGYPPDMLDLDLDLEADLGVDTVKQAETFAAIRERYGIERDDSLALRDYPTLQHVIGFVYERAPGLTQETSQPEPQAEGEDSPESGEGSLAGDDAAAAGIPRRIPTALLRPPLDHCLPTGVSLDGSRIVAMMDEGGVGKALIKQLKKQGADVLAIDDAPDAEELLERLDDFGAEEPITGVYWLTALDDEGPVNVMDFATWKESLRVRVKLLYATMRHLYDTVGAAGTFLVSATRMGGRHGYDDAGATSPMGGAVSGFTKAYHREKPEALTKVVDFPSEMKTTAVASSLIEETESDPGAVEVGRTGAFRWAVGLTEETIDETHRQLGDNSVFVITGAAGSIVSAITADLARASGGTFHLLDLVELPDRDDPDVSAFASDRDGLKQTIFERLKEQGEKATPVVIDRLIAGIERGHAALTAVQAIEDAGGAVHYHQVNLLDHEALSQVVAEIVETSGKVDLLLHAGGLEISKRLPDKEPAEYDLVFDVKADGWFGLMKGLSEVDLGATVAFSSVAGRFGNDGQTDYSAANDLLCKMTSNFKTSRPETLGVAIDWTAWGDIGMATRGSIPTIMKAAGIDMLPASAGIPIVRREVTLRPGTGEVVIGQRLGILAEEAHETGGLDSSSVSAERGLLTGSDSFGVYSGLVATIELDPQEQAFLFDHQIDDTPVLPGVMGMELFAEAALLGFPDRYIVAVEDVSFQAPFKFYRNEPRQVRVEVRYTTDGNDIVASCRLIGSRELANQTEPQTTVHFEGTVRLGDQAPAIDKREAPATADGVAHDEVYAIYFHGPAYQVIDTAWAHDGGMATTMTAPLPENHSPSDRETVTTPRLAELCFQTAGLLGIATSGAMALPTSLSRVVFASEPADDAAVRAVARPRDDGGYDCQVIDESGTVLVDMTGYRTVELPAPLDESLAEPIRSMVESAD